MSDRDKALYALNNISEAIDLLLEIEDDNGKECAHFLAYSLSAVIRGGGLHQCTGERLLDELHGMR